MKSKLYFSVVFLLILAICTGCSSSGLSREDFCIFDENGNMLVDIDKTDNGRYFIYDETKTEYYTNRNIGMGSTLAEVVSAYSDVTAQTISLSGDDKDDEDYTIYEHYVGEKIDILEGDAREVSKDVSIEFVNKGYHLELHITNRRVTAIRFFNSNGYKEYWDSINAKYKD